MTEPSTDQVDEQPDLDALDPDQFLGTAFAGDASPGEFTSNDQSARPRAADEDTE